MAIQVSPRHGAVIVPYDPRITNLFPHAKQITSQGNSLVVLPHGLDETRLLRNLGFDVPAPILWHYDWPSGDNRKPFESQRVTAAMLTLEDRAFVLNDMGTGKTLASLWAYDFLRKTGKANKLLISATLSTLTRVWMMEIFQHLPHLSAVVLYGAKEKRQKLLAEDHDVYIINHDGLVVMEADLLRRPDIDCVILDELALFRNGRAFRSKSCRRIIKARRWVWGMTGSPTPKEPTDAYGQIALLRPQNLEGMGFTRFREKVMNKVTNFKWAPKKEAADTVHALMQPSVRYTLDDVVELPEMVEQTINVALGPLQARVYAALEQHSLATVLEGTVVALNEASCRTKLLQVATGWVYTAGRGISQLDADERLEATFDIIDAARGKVIVFVPFIHALVGIAAYLRSKGISVATVSGQTPNGERNKIFNEFQNGPGIKALVAHPKCMAHGLTLTSADTIVWYAPTDDLETFDQANRRIRRPGQKSKQLMAMLAGTAIERRVYARLRAKQSMQGILLDMYEAQTRKETT